VELSWSTFLLEIINFLVLLWILKRFLYKPVLEVIARRREAIEAGLAQASQLHNEADSLKTDYESRLDRWHAERQQARTELEKELNGERQRQLQALRENLDQERKKSRVAAQRQQEEEQKNQEYRALRQGAEFTAKLLQRAAGPELEDRLIGLLLEELGHLPDEQLARLRGQWGDHPKTLKLTSAFPLAEACRQQLQEALRQMSGLDLPLDYSQDPSLVAGVEVTIGAWVLQANIRDELKGFTEFAYVAK